MGHLDAAQIVEVVVLAKARVARGEGAPGHRERVGPDRLVDLRAPRRELLGREVGGEERESFLGGELRRGQAADEGSRETHETHVGLPENAGDGIRGEEARPAGERNGRRSGLRSPRMLAGSRPLGDRVPRDHDRHVVLAARLEREVHERATSVGRGGRLREGASDRLVRDQVGQTVRAQEHADRRRAAASVSARPGRTRLASRARSSGRCGTGSSRSPPRGSPPSRRATGPSSGPGSAVRGGRSCGRRTRASLRRARSKAPSPTVAATVIVVAIPWSFGSAFARSTRVSRMRWPAAPSAAAPRRRAGRRAA